MNDGQPLRGGSLRGSIDEFIPKRDRSDEDARRRTTEDRAEPMDDTDPE